MNAFFKKYIVSYSKKEDKNHLRTKLHDGRRNRFDRVVDYLIGSIIFGYTRALMVMILLRNSTIPVGTARTRSMMIGVGQTFGGSQVFRGSG